MTVEIGTGQRSRPARRWLRDCGPANLTQPRSRSICPQTPNRQRCSSTRPPGKLIWSSDTKTVRFTTRSDFNSNSRVASMKDFDVVVIGAGLAGLQVSRLLAERRWRVLLVDRKSSLEQSIHTTGIFVRRTLEDFALPEDCLGPPVIDVILHSPARRSMDLVSPHDEFRVGRMGLLYQKFLHNCRRAGVEWMPATRCVEHTNMKARSIVRLEQRTSSFSVRTRFIVGADGATSRVAFALGLDQNREWIVGVEEVLEGVPLEGPPRFHCFLDPRLAPGYLGWLVHDGEEVHLGVGGYPARFDPLKALREFRASLNGMVDLSRARLIERRGGRIPVGGVLRRIANDQGLLVGDAAGAVSPLTAGGLDPCMRLSTFAARVIGAYLE